jgi:hypothetical protein
MKSIGRIRFLHKTHLLITSIPWQSGFPSWINGREEVGEFGYLIASRLYCRCDSSSCVTLQARGVRSRLGRRRQTWTSTRVWTACGARSSGWLGYGRRQASVAGPGTPVRYPYLSHIVIPMYLKNVSQLISIILNTYPNYPTYLVIYPTYPLHAYVADKWPR